MGDPVLLPRDRYDPAELIAQLTNQPLGADSGVPCFWLVLKGDRPPVYFSDGAGGQEHARAGLAEFLAEIRALDNRVQASLEAEFRSVGGALDDFRLYIGWVRVDDGHVTVRYWGEVVNIEYEALFQKDDHGKWVLFRATKC
jgi:hypothetical protein